MDELRRCRMCSEEKPLSEFSRGEHGKRTHKCKVCAAAHLREWYSKNKEHARKYAREYQSSPGRAERKREYNRGRHYDMSIRERNRDNRLQREFGITLAEYNEMLTAQDNRCAICRTTCKTGRELAVDHCHETSTVRGLLCSNCNRALGWFQDSPDLLISAAAYLLQNRDVLREVSE